MICPFCGLPLDESGESGTGWDDEPVGYCLEVPEQALEKGECGG